MSEIIPTPSAYAAKVAARNADRDLAQLENLAGAYSRAIASYRASVQHEDPELADLALKRTSILQTRVTAALAASPIQGSPALSEDAADIHVDGPLASPSASSSGAATTSGAVPLPSFSGTDS